MAKDIDLQDSAQEFKGFAPSNRVATPSYTQAELADRLQVSVTTVKKYIGRVRQIFEWLSDSDFTDAKGKYQQWVLDQLFAYQSACGASKLDKQGQLVENVDPISFQEYRAFVWGVEKYNPQVAEPVVHSNSASSSIVVVETQKIERTGFSSIMDNRESTNDAIANFKDGFAQNSHSMRTLGALIGAKMGEEVGNQMAESFFGRLQQVQAQAVETLARQVSE